MTLCWRGLHDLDEPGVAYITPSTGERQCGECKRLREKGLLPPREALCKAGLHRLDDPANVEVVPSTGQRQCKPCHEARAAARRAKQ